jgi:hypothetical protein
MRAVLLLLVGMLAAGPAAAASLVILDDARYVAFDDSGPVRPAPGESLFQAHVGGFSGFSEQTSTLAPDGFTGTALIFSEFPPADTVFDVLFTVDAPSAFALSGQLTPSAESSAFLSDSTGAIQILTGGPGGVFALNGTLSPDTQYRLIVGIQGGIGGQWNLDLSLPEPSLALLLGVTALLAAFRQTRFQ